MVFVSGALLMGLSAAFLVYMLFYSIKYDVMEVKSEKAVKSTFFYPTGHHGLIALSTFLLVLGQGLMKYSETHNLWFVLSVVIGYIVILFLLMCFPLFKNSSGMTFPKYRVQGFGLSLILFVICLLSVLIIKFS